MSHLLLGCFPASKQPVIHPATIHHLNNASALMEEKYITGQELKQHNKPGDLWISVQGKIYDVSEWIKDHPGGEAPLLNLSGEDATDAFIAYHPGSAWKNLDALFTGYYLKDLQVSEISRDYRRTAAEFARLGLFEKKGHVAMCALASVFIMFSAVVYGVLACQSACIHILSAALLGFVWIQSAYVGHDSGHYQVMSGPIANKFVQIMAGNCMTGISMAWWKWTHNAHHISCNSLDHDPDVQHIPVFAVSSRLFQSIWSSFYGRKLIFDPLARFFVSYQHWTFYPVMCVARVNLYLQTMLLLFSRRKVPDRAVNIIGVLIFWTWFPLLVSSLPNWRERVFFVVTSFVVTSIQHIQFCLNHFAANVYLGPPGGNDWFEKQAGGTLDIACSSWMDWFHGGLQFQLEHHLFPRLPRCQLRRISPLVKELCKKHKLPYNSLSFWEANVWTINRLRTVALQARDATNPVPKNLLWEAVNTHG